MVSDFGVRTRGAAWGESDLTVPKLHSQGRSLKATRVKDVSTVYPLIEGHMVGQREGASGLPGVLASEILGLFGGGATPSLGCGVGWAQLCPWPWPWSGVGPALTLALAMEWWAWPCPWPWSGWAQPWPWSGVGLASALVLAVEWGGPGLGRGVGWAGLGRGVGWARSWLWSGVGPELALEWVDPALALAVEWYGSSRGMWLSCKVPTLTWDQDVALLSASSFLSLSLL